MRCVCWASVPARPRAPDGACNAASGRRRTQHGVPPLTSLPHGISLPPLLPAQELATLRPKAEDAATRLGDARSKLQSDEATLKAQLAAAEAAAKRREHDLTVRIKQQQEALQATRLEADELANVSMVRTDTNGRVACCPRC